MDNLVFSFTNASVDYKSNWDDMKYKYTIDYWTIAKGNWLPSLFLSNILFSIEAMFLQKCWLCYILFYYC